MNKFLRISTIVVFVFVVCLGFLTYWLGGGDFERGEMLGFTFIASLVSGGILSGLYLTLAYPTGD